MRTTLKECAFYLLKSPVKRDVKKCKISKVHLYTVYTGCYTSDKLQNKLF